MRIAHPDRIVAPAAQTQSPRHGDKTAPIPTAPRVTIINFNAPELNALAGYLADRGHLAAFVRTYVNRARWWERLLSALPGAGSVYRSTFGRRQIENPRLLALTQEAGVLPDMAGAAAGRATALPVAARHRLGSLLAESVRQSVAAEGQKFSRDATCVVAYHGFALAAFRANPGTIKVLNYPSAHHRQQRKMLEEERKLEPEFADTWRPFDADWPRDYERQLDAEIAIADAVLVGSSYARDSFVAEGVASSKLWVVPYGVDLGLFTAANDTQRSLDLFRVVFAGQLIQRKGISYLLRAYREFRKSDTRLTLIGSFVAGDAPFRGYMGDFEHIPHLTRPHLAERYRSADVFVFPTLSEGMGLVVLEAMACGLPVIVTSHGPGDIVRDGIDGFVVPPRNPQAIRDCLETLYSDRALGQRMGASARLRAAEFGWDAYASKVFSHITNIA